MAGRPFLPRGLIFMLLSLAAFGKSFRLGIDEEHTEDLIPTGVFAVSRNLIYLAFWFVLLGEFLLFPNWIVPVYLAAASWLLSRQVLREEKHLSRHYGQQLASYCHRVRRYL